MDDTQGRVEERGEYKVNRGAMRMLSGTDPVNLLAFADLGNRKKGEKRWRKEGEGREGGGEGWKWGGREGGRRGGKEGEKVHCGETVEGANELRKGSIERVVLNDTTIAKHPQHKEDAAD